MAYVKRLRGICQPITRHMSNDENDAVLARSLLGSSAEIALAHISCGFEDHINPFLYFLIIVSKFIPSFENEMFGMVFSVLAYLVVFQNTEGLVDAAFATDIFWV